MSTQDIDKNFLPLAALIAVVGNCSQMLETTQDILYDISRITSPVASSFARHERKAGISTSKPITGLPCVLLTVYPYNNDMSLSITFIVVVLIAIHFLTNQGGDE